MIDPSGAAVIPVLDAVLSRAADDGLESAVLGMAHRGRLNVLANVMGKSFDQIFRWSYENIRSFAPDKPMLIGENSRAKKLMN